MSSVIDRPAQPPHDLPGRHGARLRVNSEMAAWGAVGILLVITGAVVFYLTRGTTFWFDEWLWITSRRATTAATFLHPYNGHFSLVPVAIYKVLFATAGLKHYSAYRAVLVAGHLACVLLMFVYARRRVGALLALLAAAVIAFMGPGWQDILWPFQIAWMIVLAAGAGALLALEREDRSGDVGACVLLGIALASTSAGLAVAAGLVVEIAWVRRRWRDAWIAAIPLLLYAAWSLAYQDTAFLGSLSATVQFVAQSAADSLSVVTGLSGMDPINGKDQLLTFGPPLAVAAVALVIWMWRTGRPFTRRTLTVATMLVAFWVLTGLGRSDVSLPNAPRYLYVDAFFVLLLAGELAAFVRVGPAVRGLLVLAAAAVVVANFGVLRNAAAFLRSAAQSDNAEVAALNLSRRFATPRYVATAFPGYPFLVLHPSALFPAEEQLGWIGYSPAQLAAAPDEARHVADAQMVDIRALSLRPAVGAAPTGISGSALAPLTVGGTTRARGACVDYQAQATGAGQSSALYVRVAAGGVSISASGAPASAGVRRFGAEFVPVGTVAAGGTGTLTIPPDGLDRPWVLQLLSSGRLSVCAR